MTALRLLVDLWRHVTYRDITRPHPHTAAALRQLAERTPQTYEPYPGRPS